MEKVGALAKKKKKAVLLIFCLQLLKSDIGQ